MAEQSDRAKPHMTGMQGVYLVAAELTKQGFIVSPTSRSAFGADLLVTDEKCRKAWSVQVKTNNGRPKFWLLNKHAKEAVSPSHVYVLVNLGQKNTRQKLSPADLYVVPSRYVARKMTVTPRKTGSIWYWIGLDQVRGYANKWSVFQKAD